jgi:hypothetical protein
MLLMYVTLQHHIQSTRVLLLSSSNPQNAGQEACHSCSKHALLVCSHHTTLKSFMELQ